MSYFTEKVSEISELGFYALETALEWKDVPMTPEIQALLIERGIREGDESTFDFFLLTQEPYPFGLFFAAHGRIEKESLRLRLRLARRPTEQVPKWITKISDDAGGYPAGLAKMRGIFEHFKGTCTVNAKFLFPPDDGRSLRPKIRPRDITLDGKPLKKSHETIGWTLEDESTAEVTFWDDNSVMIEIDSSLELSIQEDCFKLACDAMMEKLQPFLEKV